MRTFILMLPLLTNACALLNELPDTPFEEMVEELVERETGVRIDITGSTPEQEKTLLPSVQLLKF